MPAPVTMPISLSVPLPNPSRYSRHRSRRHTRRSPYSTPSSNSSSRSNTPPPPFNTPALPDSDSTVTIPLSTLPTPFETDAQVWYKMVSLQRQYRCYNSARIEAAVEALDRWGMRWEDVGVPSRTCLDLLNESLSAQLAAAEVGFYRH